MIGGILITHGEFAPGIKNAVEMIAGVQENLIAISLHEGDGLETLMQKIQCEMGRMNADEYILFVDVFGATPCNAASVICSITNCTVIAGINLPILLEFVTKRNYNDKEVLIEQLRACALEDFKIIEKKDLQ